MSGKLKLRAEDAEDLKVVSAYLQDAILPIGDLCYLPDQQRFVMVVNRFKWESCGDPPPLQPGPTPDEDETPCPYERTNCGVHIDGVTAIRSRGIDMRDRTLMLDLLALSEVENGIELHFAGDGCLHLEAARWRCVVCDIGEPWPTPRKPHHDIGEEADSGGAG